MFKLLRRHVAEAMEARSRAEQTGASQEEPVEGNPEVEQADEWDAASFSVKPGAVWEVKRSLENIVMFSSAYVPEAITTGKRSRPIQHDGHW